MQQYNQKTKLYRFNFLLIFIDLFLFNLFFGGALILFLSSWLLNNYNLDFFKIFNSFSNFVLVLFSFFYILVLLFISDFWSQKIIKIRFDSRFLSVLLIIIFFVITVTVYLTFNSFLFFLNTRFWI